MDERERQIRIKLRDNYPHYALKCLKIRPRKGEVFPFILNKAQLHLHEVAEDQRRRTGKVRIITVKGRQLGVSTYVGGRFYWRVTHSFGVRAFILTHDKEATNNLFDMTKRFHENCPQLVRPSIQASNSKELIFGDLDSGYKLGTAGNKGVGRSSTIQFLHGSETAYWPNAAEHAKGILQAVPDQAGTEIFFESTAKGVGNYFHEQWQLAESGKSDFIAVFLPWFWDEDYIRDCEEDFQRTEEEDELANLYKLSNEQLSWRRNKIIELSAGGMDGARSFKSEYPSNSIEAFETTGNDTFIPPNIVMPARKGDAEPYGKLVIGVDPARFGDDRTSIIRRQGRVASKLERYEKKDTMEVAGIIHNIIEQEKPYRVCIDIGGLGAGVYDRLVELGHRETVVSVNFGSMALNNKKYGNKRAEIWSMAKQWLQELPCKIPDDDSLHADLCSPKYKFDSNGRLFLEKKEDMKRRGIRSPDAADSLALTFSCPISELTGSKEASNTIVEEMAREMNRINRIRHSN